MIKRSIAIICLFLLVVFAALVGVLHSARATSVLAAFLIRKNIRNLTLDGLTIASQRFIFPRRLILSDVKLRVTSNKEHYEIHINEVDIQELNTAASLSAVLPLRVTALSLEHKDFKVSVADFKGILFLKRLRFQQYQGILAIAQMEAYRYKVKNVQSSIAGSLKSVSLNDIRADFYNGKINGQVDVGWSDKVRYHTDLKFAGVDLNSLKEIDDSICGQIEGIIQGDLSLGGSPKSFDTLGLRVQIAKNGRMNASLLKFIIPYIPRTEDSVKLLEIMKVPGSKVPVEIARMDLRTADEHKISGDIKLGVGRLNLDLNLPIDILYDGNLFSLITWFKKLGK